jgi:hypothetical protein
VPPPHPSVGDPDDPRPSGIPDWDTAPVRIHIEADTFSTSRVFGLIGQFES